MSNKYDSHSIPELLGIILMLVGIGLGYYSVYIDAHRANVIDENMEIFTNPSSELGDMKTSMDAIMPSLTLDIKLTAHSRCGIFTFLAGLGVFVVARRRRWNAAQRNDDMSKNNTEQTGPGTPPQGVGSPLNRDVRPRGDEEESMSIQLSKEETSQLISSIQKYFREELEQDMSELQAQFLLDYVLKEIAPFAYNKGVSDAETYLLNQIGDLRGTCFEQGLTYWRQKQKARQ